MQHMKQYINFPNKTADTTQISCENVASTQFIRVSNNNFAISLNTKITFFSFVQFFTKCCHGKKMKIFSPILYLFLRVWFVMHMRLKVLCCLWKGEQDVLSWSSLPTLWCLWKSFLLPLSSKKTKKVWQEEKCWIDFASKHKTCSQHMMIHSFLSKFNFLVSFSFIIFLCKFMFHHNHFNLLFCCSILE